MDEKRREYQKKYRQEYKQKTTRVHLTLSKQEHRDFLREAKSQDIKLTSLVKKLALAGLHNQAHIPSSLKKELQTLNFAIHNIANNINQIAHHSNTIHNMTTSDDNNLLSHIKQLQDIVETYTQGQILDSEK